MAATAWTLRLFIHILPSFLAFTSAQVDFPCVKFCLQWDPNNGVELNTPLTQDVEYKLAQEAEVTCPPWLSPDAWDLINPDTLNSQICDLGWDSTCEDSGGPDCVEQTITFAEICGPSVAPENARQSCIDSLSSSSGSGTAAIPSIPGPPPDPIFDRGGGGDATWDTEPSSTFYEAEWELWWTLAEFANTGLGYPNAARHMFHFLNNTGRDLLINPGHMMYDIDADDQNHVLHPPTLTDRVMELLHDTAADTFAKVAKGDGGSTTFRSVWKSYTYEDLIQQDWFFADGGWSYSVAGVLTAHKLVNWEATINYVVYVVDRYNWDTGKGLFDSFLANLHVVGLAKEYTVRGKSSVFQVDGWAPGAALPRPNVGPYIPCIVEDCPLPK